MMPDTSTDSPVLANASQIALAIVRSLPDAAVFVIDHDLRLRFVCGPVLERLGWDVELFTGRLAQDILPADYFAAYEPHYRGALAGGTSELENDSIHGGIVFHSQFSPLQDEDGAVVGALVVSRDVTTQWRLEAARARMLRERDEARSQFETAFAEAPCGMAVVGRDGRWLRVNRRVCEILGWTRDELLGSSCPGLIDHGELALAANPETAGVARQIEKAWVNALGDEIWLSLSLSIVRDRTGAPLHFILQVVDVGERRRLMQEASDARDRALELSRLKSAFVANMSHEIRTPLNGVIGLSDLLLDTELSDDQRDFAEGVRASGAALMAVISDILDVSKIEAGRLELDDEDFELRAVVDEACTIVAPVVGDKPVELMAWVDGALPLVVRGDAKRLRQVLVNLLNNAVKFTDAGEVVVRLTAHDDGGVLVEVTDTGVGIAADGLERLFEAFTQAAPARGAAHSGTGLGLSISKQLVELMGGAIGARSAPGEGSTFFFTLPLGRAHHPTPAAAPRLNLSGLRVLAADDNSTNRTILRCQLGSYGLRCDLATDGSEAMRLLHTATNSGERYDLAVLDRHMPGMNDLELINAIRANPRLQDLPILILSSACGGREALRASGVDGVLTKPVGDARLREEIERILAGSPRPAPEIDAPGPAGAAPRHLRILLAEDNEVSQLVATRVLERCGYRVDLAATGREAVDMSRSGIYDAILMDCELPEMDGLAAAREIRRLEGSTRHTPIVALTAHTMRGDRERCLAAGMDDHVSKPLRRETLDDVLRRLVPAPRDGWSGLDPAVLDQLGPDAVAAVVPVFLESASERLGALEKALAAGDDACVRRIAHGLKGAAASVGAVELARTCEPLHGLAELATRADAVRARELLADVQESFARTASALEPRDQEDPS